MSTSIPDSASDRPSAGASAERTTAFESQALLDARLDAIDQALLGLLPRGERLELVAKVEARLHERLAGGDEAVVETLRTPAAASIASGLALASAPTRQKKRSQIAVAAGIVGLASLALLFLLPVVYIVFTIGADLLDETIVLGALGSMHLLVFMAGIIAVMCGIVGLVKLSRHSERLRGHGWAITGLCCGPLPMFVGGLPLLLIGLPMVLTTAFVTQTATPTVTVQPTLGPHPSPVAGCSSGTCMPASPATGPYVQVGASGLPLPAAPAYYPADTAPIPPAPLAPPVGPAGEPWQPAKPSLVGPSSPEVPPTNETTSGAATPATDETPTKDDTPAADNSKADEETNPNEDAASDVQAESD